MSRDNAAKKARRKKRQAAHRISTAAFEQVAAIEDAVVADLAEFDERITLRGWIFDEEESNDDYAVWFFEPSGGAGRRRAAGDVTVLDATEDGAIVRVVLVGTTTQHPFTHDQLFEHLQVIEDYRNGDPVPEFG